MEAIRAKYWKRDDDLDLKRRKEAEFLIHGDLPIDAIIGYMVYNKNAKNKLLEFGIPDKGIYINAESYF